MLYLKLDDLIFDIEKDICLEFLRMNFNGGEKHIIIKPKSVEKYREPVIIETSLINSDKVMELLLATDALKRLGYNDIYLFAPYLPYARQDRVCNIGESLSIKVMCNLINAQDYRKVFTLDNHSEVANALLNNHAEINLADIIMRVTSENSVEKPKDFKRYALVSPDAGALKKTHKLSKVLGGVPVIECSKERDVRTGNITRTLIHTLPNDMKSFEHLLIVDDICDGGRTFIELAKELRHYNIGPIDLFVSHGIFSQGIKPLTESNIGIIYTTKSFMNDVKVIREPFYVADFTL